jgi:hypothetical protein
MKELNKDFKGYSRKSCTAFSSIKSTAYLFWKDNSNIMMQKIDFIEYPKNELYIYKPILIKDDFFFNQFKKNRKAILSEDKIKQHRTHLTIENEKNQSVSTGFSMTSHSCYRMIKIINDNEEFIKAFDYYDLKKQKLESESKPNINYDFNNNLQFVKWDKMININIEAIEKTTELELITQ